MAQKHLQYTPFQNNCACFSKERHCKAEGQRVRTQMPLNLITTIHGNSKSVAGAKFYESKKGFAFEWVKQRAFAERTFSASKLVFPLGLLEEHSKTHLNKMNKMFQMGFTPFCGIQRSVGQYREALEST